MDRRRHHVSGPTHSHRQHCCIGPDRNTHSSPKQQRSQPNSHAYKQPDRDNFAEPLTNHTITRQPHLSTNHNPCSNTDAYSNRDSNANPNANPFAHADGYSNTHSNPNTNCDALANSVSNTCRLSFNATDIRFP